MHNNNLGDRAVARRNERQFFPGLTVEPGVKADRISIGMHFC